MRVAEPTVVRRARIAVGSAVRAADLDERLAVGFDPLATPQLSRRAAKLVSRAHRRRIADTLARYQAELDDPAARIRSLPAPELQVDEVRRAGVELDALVKRLRAAAPIRPQGAALARLLVTAPTSPIYERSVPGTLTRATRGALAALEPGE